MALQNRRDESLGRKVGCGMVHVNSNKLSVIGWGMNVYVSGKLLFLDETGSDNRNVHSKHGYRAPRVN